MRDVIPLADRVACSLNLTAASGLPSRRTRGLAAGEATNVRRTDSRPDSFRRHPLSTIIAIVMSTAKRHHYLPESYMRRFALKDRVWVYDTVRRCVRRDSPHNVAVESEFYTLWTQLGSKDRIAEERLAELDDVGPRAIEKLEIAQEFMGSDRWAIAYFIAFAQTRGPSFRRARREVADQKARIAVRRQSEQIQQAMRRFADERGVVDLAKLARDYDASVLPDRQTEMAIMVDAAVHLAPHYYEMAWQVGRNVSRTDFITSDRPIATFPPDNWAGPYGSLTPEATNVFPLSGRTALFFGHKGDPSIIGDFDVRDEWIPTINSKIAARAERYVVARHERAAREAASLLADRIADKMVVVELYDPVGNRNLEIELDIRSDVQFPFVAMFDGACPQCRHVDRLRVLLIDPSTPQDSNAYSQWLDGSCAGCGVSRRVAAPKLRSAW